MKSTQSGFALVGVAIAMVAVLAGSAYVFRNAGTSEDLVAQVSRSVKGKNTGPGGSGGSGTRPCPAECKRLYDKARNAWRGYIDAIGASETACKTNPSSSACMRAKKKEIDAEEKSDDATRAYAECVNRHAAAQSCPMVHEIRVSCEQIENLIDGAERRIVEYIRDCKATKPAYACRNDFHVKQQASWYEQWRQALGYKSCLTTKEYFSATELINSLTRRSR